MESWQHKEAKKRVQKIKRFYSNLSSWVIISIFLSILALWTSPDFFWAIFPIAGWGIGVAFHAIDVFGFPGIGNDWEQRRMQKELDRLEEQEYAKKWRDQEKQRYLESGDISPEKDELKLKELRKEWNDSDFV